MIFTNGMVNAQIHIDGLGMYFKKNETLLKYNYPGYAENLTGFDELPGGGFTIMILNHFMIRVNRQGIGTLMQLTKMRQAHWNDSPQVPSLHYIKKACLFHPLHQKRIKTKSYENTPYHFIAVAACFCGGL